jgi:hypothetical protein
MAHVDRINRGAVYEDCRYHPMLCIQPSPPGDDELVGISLIDGAIGACSEDHCGVVRMTVDEAIERKVQWDRLCGSTDWPKPTFASARSRPTPASSALPLIRWPVGP